MFENVKQFLVDELRVKPEDITMEAELAADLGVNSLELAELVLACEEMIFPIIAVIIIGRDIVVDSIKMLIGNKGKAVAAIGVAKYKTATLMVGLTLKLFYDLPFSLFISGVSDFLLIVAAVLSIVSGAKYYMMAEEYITDK